ncbi:Ribokinase [Galdieria sulphuraria]|nr:Ribokinase [Galdieria sulphuraria]
MEPERNICVIGSLNVDLVATATKIPVKGETILASSFAIRYGGKGANQAVACSRLGIQTNLVAKIGDDDYGRQAMEKLAEYSVNTSTVIKEELESTGLALIVVEEETGENVITVVSGANARLSSEDVLRHEEAIVSCSICLLQLEIPLYTVKKTIEIAKRNQIKVILNPAPFQLLNDEILYGIDILVPNVLELEILLGLHIPDSTWYSNDDSETAVIFGLVDRLQRKFQNLALVITLGKRGCIVCPHMENKHLNAFLIEPYISTHHTVDTTGAGDCFCGALAVGLMEYGNLLEAARFANIAAGISVTRQGTQESYPSREQVEYLLKDNQVARIQKLNHIKE